MYAAEMLAGWLAGLGGSAGRILTVCHAVYCPPAAVLTPIFTNRLVVQVIQSVCCGSLYASVFRLNYSMTFDVDTWCVVVHLDLYVPVGQCYERKMFLSR